MQVNKSTEDDKAESELSLSPREIIIESIEEIEGNETEGTYHA